MREAKIVNLISNDVDLTGIDCHIHSRFSPDAYRAGADDPETIADTVRKRGLKGFIITDHIDVGHWKDCKKIDFDEYFDTWNAVRKNNPDLTIYIGLEVGFELEYVAETEKLIQNLPIEYLINSVHYWQDKKVDADGTIKYAFDGAWANGKTAAYTKYLKYVSASLDCPYPFSAIGHLGFPERYSPLPENERAMEYQPLKPLFDGIIAKALARKVRFEENTNAGGMMRQPRADFLRAYKAAGGVRPVLGSDAHVSANIGQYFSEAKAFLDGIFG